MLVMLSTHLDVDMNFYHEYTAYLKGKNYSINLQTIDIRQKKTGAKTSIPVSSELKSILERYDYQLHRLEDQVLNRYMKDICKLSGLDELIEIQTTKGGTPIKERKPKWELVHSQRVCHTSPRNTLIIT